MGCKNKRPKTFIEGSKGGFIDGLNTKLKTVFLVFDDIKGFGQTYCI